MTIKIPQHSVPAKEIKMKDIFKIIKGVTNGRAWQMMVVDKEYVFDTNIHTELQAEWDLEVLTAKKKS